jgi:hypothetical protein
MKQDLYSTFYIKPVTLRSSSPRIALDINYSAGKHYFYTSNDLGWTRSDSAFVFTRHYTSLRITGNYLYQYWSFNWLLQRHAYYLTDELQPGGPATFSIYSFGPMVHYPLPGNSLILSGGYNANYYGSTRTWNHSLHGEVDYNLPDNWAIRGQVFYNYYRAAYGQTIATTYPSFTQVRIGVQKCFISNHQPGNVRLRLTLYEDKNSNGHRDQDEVLAQHVIVKVDDHPAISNANGVVEYDNLTSGMHTISIDRGKEWNIQGPLTLPVTRNTKMELPLVRSSELAGKVIIEKKKYETVTPDLEGIRINARDDQGRSYTTLTDEQGAFRFYLPVGKYTLTVQVRQGSGSQEASKEITLKTGNNEEVSFVMEDRRRKIDVKQF